ncbi:type III-A CRISPR-associated protein Cas10/Csm1 [Herpetosiphon sp. NSE202]|uniref:type III-A CRISPR-associated protein Cas10/Csm1 n=1 Tax=Herpetosiphon sp. NSE202 TaxID=3351349 RepID=UPI003635A24D
MSDPPVIGALKSMTNSVKAWSNTPLESIFNQISSATEPTSAPYFLQAQRFSLSETALFPGKERPQVSADLHNEFMMAINQCSEDPSTHLAQMLSIFQDYAWAVSYQTSQNEPVDPVVSLYDYARTKAALAAAGDQALLVGGDISGVQDFIYTIAANRAAKSLRGRSFYLQMLTEALAGWVLAQAGMPSSNLLYSGGGRFYAIVPAECSTHIAQWRRELGQFLLSVHDGELYVALGAATIVDADHDFGALFRAVNDNVTADKRRRFATLDSQTIQASLFTPRGHRGNEEDRCATCGYMGPTKLFVNEQVDVGETAGKLCLLCESTIKLGFSLHYAQFLCISRPDSKLNAVTERASSKDILAALGTQVEICASYNELLNYLEKNSNGSIHVQIIRPFANDLKLLTELRSQYRQHVFSFRPIVNVTPKQPNGAVKSFDQLADASRGIKRFGVLRMDVDDLGDIFGYSLAKSSLARISSLSAAFSRFFEGWVGEICRNQQLITSIYQADQTQSEQIYSVYSGGDDLFVVGGWDVLPHIANRIQYDLQRYTGYNPLIHVSAGLSLHTKKFPLYQAAKLAHHALDEAKDAAPRKAIRKNALTFLDQTIAWEAYPALVAWHQQLWQLYQAEHGMVRSLLQVLMELYSQYHDHGQRRRESGKKQTAYGPWIWHGKYQLARIRERHKHNQQLEDLLLKIDKTLFTGFDDPDRISLRTIEQLGLAARWTQLLIREQGD